MKDGECGFNTFPDCSLPFETLYDKQSTFHEHTFFFCQGAFCNKRAVQSLSVSAIYGGAVGAYH
jgi:hypothetical protein